MVRSSCVKRLRRTLLELWAIAPVAAVVGFLGPFGSYLAGDFLMRFGRWAALLLGAYVLARPALLFWHWVAQATGLPRRSLTLWGMVLSSFPMALVWRLVGRDEIQLLGGYSGLLPFALLCSLLIMAVAWWAERADAHLLAYYGSGPSREWTAGISGSGLPDPMLTPPRPAEPRTPATGSSSRPRLYARLSSSFDGPILALESEDHYVRVHGMHGSELLLLRLRDAIVEMDQHPGEQTHRSWWVSRGAVAGVSGTGRTREVRLVNGLRVPVARDSISRLERSGFLPAA
jgi:hypothetical protein